jgi:hypothetical protein
MAEHVNPADIDKLRRHHAPGGRLTWADVESLFAEIDVAAAAERAQIVAWLNIEGDDENEADSELIDSIALRICSELYPKCERPESGHCGTCQYSAKSGARAVASAIAHGDHARPEPAREGGE